VNHLGNAWPLTLQATQSFIERNDLPGIFLSGQIGNLTNIQCEAALTGSTTFLACPGAGVLDENPPHRVGGGGEEMTAAVPGEFGVGDQPGVGLMNQSGRLQRVSGPLFAHALLRDFPQLIVYER